jgi:hypothetical protein
MVFLKRRKKDKIKSEGNPNKCEGGVWKSA